RGLAARAGFVQPVVEVADEGRRALGEREVALAVEEAEPGRGQRERVEELDLDAGMRLVERGLDRLRGAHVAGADGGGQQEDLHAGTASSTRAQCASSSLPSSCSTRAVHDSTQSPSLI